MDETEKLLQLLVGIATLITLIWGLLKMFASAAEAKLSRAEAVEASRRAEFAASEAARHVVHATAAVGEMASNIQKIELATNSMKDALVEVTGKEAFARGVEAERKRGGVT